MMNESTNNLSKEQQFYIKKARQHKHLVLFFQIFIFAFFIRLRVRDCFILLEKDIWYCIDCLSIVL